MQVNFEDDESSASESRDLREAAVLIIVGRDALHGFSRKITHARSGFDFGFLQSAAAIYLKIGERKRKAKLAG